MNINDWTVRFEVISDYYNVLTVAMISGEQLWSIIAMKYE